MKEYLKILSETRLFHNMAEADIESMLHCLQAEKAEYKKGEYIFRHGENINRIALLIKGQVHLEKSDYWGNLHILNVVTEKEMFAEAYAFPESGPFLCDAVAVENSVVLFFNARKILTTCSSACHFHLKTLENLFRAVSEKNLSLVWQLDHLTQRSTREKLISYLSEESMKHNSSSFSIPFNRQQLADFLSVDRSAMSLELSKMQKEGLLKYNKNSFTLF